MATKSGTALVKARERYLKAIKTFPDRTEFYLIKIEELNTEIKLAKVCRRCGRPLKDETAMELGYGKECALKNEADAASEEE